ncbi:MAG: 16S rRNA (cytosine(967)-C(5))-methyltransferase RsmB [Deltaproteobacteria bacterium]|nr:16S rRNA (cytosine(967)-C(5))-methyltransferase RsmB [Deltaproteobacteria bacterium]
MHVPKSPRYIAIDILCRWEESRLPIDQLMERYIVDSGLADIRDRQLIKSMVYGVLRWRGYLDWVIGILSKHPLGKMKNLTIQALRVGIFQLVFLDRVPPSAAVNETVQAFKDMKQPKWLSGFVNGVLRSVERQRPNIQTPFFNSQALPETALLSHPEWLVKRWKSRFGDAETAAICKKNNREPDLCLRVNTALTDRDILLNKLKAAGLAAEPGLYSPTAVKLKDYRGSVANIPGFEQGLFQVQDEAAQLVSMLLGPLQKESFYLDGCAGLGGKTSHLAQMLPPESRLIAVEPNAGRVKKLKENLGRLRLDSAVTIVEDTVDSLLPDMQEKFSGILIDAPCSGLGVIRHHPDIRWNRTPDNLRRYQEIQSGILASAARLLVPGGTLVYATCSTEPEENDEVIQKFLAENPGFLLANASDSLPEKCLHWVDRNGYFRTIPGREGLDGFFGARLIKM